MTPAAAQTPTARAWHLHGVDLRLLNYFAVVADELHFGRAAGRLGIAQPPLSTAIKTLEQRLGVSLLDRGPRGVTLTEAGVVLLGRTRQLLAVHGLLLAEMATLRRSRTSSLCLAFPGAFAGTLLAPMVRAFTAAQTHVTVELRDVGPYAGGIPVSLAHADAALVVGRDPGDGLASLLLAESARVFIVAESHRHAKTKTIAAADMRDEPHVQLADSSPTWLAEWTPRAVTGVDPPWASTAQTFDEALELVAAGHGVVMAPALVADRNARSDLRFVPISDMPAVGIRIAWRSDNPSSALSAFLAALPRPVSARSPIQLTASRPAA